MRNRNRENILIGVIIPLILALILLSLGVGGIASFGMCYFFSCLLFWVSIITFVRVLRSDLIKYEYLFVLIGILLLIIGILPLLWYLNISDYYLHRYSNNVLDRLNQMNFFVGLETLICLLSGIVFLGYNSIWSKWIEKEMISHILISLGIVLFALGFIYIYNGGLGFIIYVVAALSIYVAIHYEIAKYIFKRQKALKNQKPSKKLIYYRKIVQIFLTIIAVIVIAIIVFVVIAILTNYIVVLFIALIALSNIGIKILLK